MKLSALLQPFVEGHVSLCLRLQHYAITITDSEGDAGPLRILVAFHVWIKSSAFTRWHYRLPWDLV